MDRASIERINCLTAISRQRELTAEEQAERKQLREAYLRAPLANACAVENTVVEYPDGTRIPFREAGRENRDR